MSKVLYWTVYSTHFVNSVPDRDSLYRDEKSQGLVAMFIWYLFSFFISV